MARPPLPVDELIQTYGPTLKYVPPGGWTQSAHHAEDRLVKTHCCFLWGSSAVSSFASATTK